MIFSWKKQEWKRARQLDKHIESLNHFRSTSILLAKESHMATPNGKGWDHARIWMNNNATIGVGWGEELEQIT